MQADNADEQDFMPHSVKERRHRRPSKNHDKGAPVPAEAENGRGRHVKGRHVQVHHTEQGHRLLPVRRRDEEVQAGQAGRAIHAVRSKHRVDKLREGNPVGIRFRAEPVRRPKCVRLVLQLRHQPAAGILEKDADVHTRLRPRGCILRPDAQRDRCARHRMDETLRNGDARRNPEPAQEGELPAQVQNHADKGKVRIAQMVRRDVIRGDTEDNRKVRGFVRKDVHFMRTPGQIHHGRIHTPVLRELHRRILESDGDRDRRERKNELKETRKMLPKTNEKRGEMFSPRFSFSKQLNHCQSMKSVENN